MMPAQTHRDATAPGYDADALPPGTQLLGGQYTIERYLSSGGFGITYLARDSLDRTVVIKECYPEALCSRENKTVRSRSSGTGGEFQSLVSMFVREARSIAKLQHPNIVGVHQVFEDNQTAYMALDLIEGQDLLCIIEDDPDSLTPDRVQVLLRTLLDAIGTVHAQDMLHRDISPDNVLVDARGNPILIDFGAAREHASKKSRAISALLVVKDGYSPQEFYISGGRQGPCSDLYGLAATFVHVITGAPPPNSQNRLAALAGNRPDPYEPLVGRVQGYPQPFLAAIDMAMNVFPNDRIQSASDWLAMIDSPTGARAKSVNAQNVDDIERMISDVVAQASRIPLIETSAREETPPPAAPEPPKARTWEYLPPEEPDEPARPTPLKRSSVVLEQFWSRTHRAESMQARSAARRRRSRRLKLALSVIFLTVAANIFTNPTDNIVSRAMPEAQEWIDLSVALSRSAAERAMTGLTGFLERVSI